MSTHSLAASALERSASRDLMRVGASLAPRACRAAARSGARCGELGRRACRSLPAGQSAAAEDARTRVEERRAARHDRSHGRTAAADLPFAGDEARTARLVLRLPAAARAGVHRAGGGPESAAEPRRDHRSLSRTDAARARRRHRAAHLHQPDRSPIVSPIRSTRARSAISGIASNPASGCDVSSPGNPQAGYPLMRRRRVSRLLPWIEHRQHPFPRNAHQSRQHRRQRAVGNPAVAARSARRQAADHAGDRQEAVRGLLQGLRSEAARRRVLDLSDRPGTTRRSGRTPRRARGPNQQMKLLQAYDAKTKQDLWEPRTRR